MEDEGCAFEELISFHGGLGGPRRGRSSSTPPTLALPAEPLVGAAAVHDVLAGWRASLQGPDSFRRRSAVDRTAAPPGDARSRRIV